MSKITKDQQKIDLADKIGNKLQELQDKIEAGDLEAKDVEEIIYNYFKKTLSYEEVLFIATTHTTSELLQVVLANKLKKLGGIFSKLSK